MQNSKQNVIILTATITPPSGATNLSRIDPNLRLNDYRNAFEFYLRHLKEGHINGLVFAENSASDISTFVKLSQEYGVVQRIEFISIEGLDYPPAYGRGYGEFKLIDYVMTHSQIIQNLPEQANIWKVTGRYTLRNLRDVIKSCPANADLYCHCRNIPIRWIDLYVLCWNKKAYGEILRNIYPLLREDIIKGSAELAFRKIIDEKNYKGKVVRRFHTLPELEGIRGLDNQNYGEMRLKILLRKLANFWVPWLWI